MDRLIKIQKEDPDAEKEYMEASEDIARQYAPPLREMVRKALVLLAEEQYEKAAGLCCRILDEDDTKPEIRETLGICYFSLGNMASAAMVFSDLVRDYPDEEEYHRIYGMTLHAMGDFRGAVRELRLIYPMKEYRPFYYASYGDSLEKEGMFRESREIFYEEIKRYEETGEILSEDMLDGVFQHLLYLDVSLGNGKYEEDLKIYYRFLEQVSMTESMQENLASTIVCLSTLMNNKWYRPLFLKFITHISNKNYLVTERTRECLESAYIAWESYAFHDDARVSRLMETGINHIYDMKYTMKDAKSKKEQEQIREEVLTWEWYLCQYIPEHYGELEYIRSTYPHSYECCRDFLEKAERDSKNTAEELLQKIADMRNRRSTEDIRKFLEDAYREICSVKRAEIHVTDGEGTYRRTEVKVGRNDPCPCGSGKKYKKCCGRN